MPLHDAIEDPGKFVCAILAEPEKFEGKRLCAAERVEAHEKEAWEAMHVERLRF
jgi:hypothetical protein